MASRRFPTRPATRSAASVDVRAVLLGRGAPNDIRQDHGRTSRPTGPMALIVPLSAVLAVAFLARALGF
ncbi:hypothetical protein IHQ68_09260 [Chelatococcus sambhunathii]|uniref:Uncharacterized protein n=1 Tax=Chelatococcus sambhunathii TaxID=363953 RepID=A0ABU1DFA4_9HYPH|nr:hypothetical protein [Chelatococcus sambhunathii]MDR4306806.1 hypothetical protein [Chelatococcus sambhunathii]